MNAIRFQDRLWEMKELIGFKLNKAHVENVEKWIKNMLYLEDYSVMAVKSDKTLNVLLKKRIFSVLNVQLIRSYLYSNKTMEIFHSGKIIEL